MRIELENRLIDFSVLINQLVLKLNKGMLSQVLGLQIIRSSSSAALNFGEAQAAESRKDFIHKISIVHKELRESEVGLKIIQRSGICINNNIVEHSIKECRELIAIFQKSLNTLRSNTKQSTSK